LAKHTKCGIWVVAVLAPIQKTGSTLRYLFGGLSVIAFFWAVYSLSLESPVTWG